MPTYRVILKKTKYLPKGSTAAGRNLKRYLSLYMDETEKLKMKNNGEALSVVKPPPLSPPENTLSDEKAGTFWTGGFLGQTKSPPAYQKNKQKSWINTTHNLWIQLLESKTKRRNDGFRFVLSLSSDSLATLKAHSLSPDQTLRDIWRKTLSLYKQQHQWVSPQHELGWLAATHHDTRNTHLHILLFPTTLSGLPLRTNNCRGPSNTNDLNNLIALANLAAEIYWRETLPLRAQSHEYLSQLRQNPEEEPPIPTLDRFNIPSGFYSKPLPDSQIQNNHPLEKWNTALLSPQQIEESELESGKKSLLDELKKQMKKREEITVLQHCLSTFQVWHAKKINPWTAKKVLNKNKYTTKTLTENLSEEVSTLKTLAPLLSLLPEGKAREELKLLQTEEFGHGLLALTSGIKPLPDPEETLQGLHKLAALYDNSIQESDSPEKLKLIQQEGIWAKREKLREHARLQKYKIILKGVECLQAQNLPTYNTIPILKALIQGSQTLSGALTARHSEAFYATISTSEGVRYRSTPREWHINQKTLKIEAGPSQGKPYPPHIDPELILPQIASLQKLPAKSSLTLLAAALSPNPTTAQQEDTPLIRFIKFKLLRRRKLAIQIARELDKIPELSMPL